MIEDQNERVPLASSENPANTLESTPVERLIAHEIETNPEPPSFRPPEPRQKPGVLLIFAGVVLPSIAVLVELTTSICAESFFDPLPTLLHVMLVIATPMANLYVIRGLRQEVAEYHWRLGLANGLAVVVSSYYALIYLPLTPIALVAIVFMGLGLLPMSPLNSLIASVVSLRRLRRLAKERGDGYGASDGRMDGLGYGLALGMLLLIVADAKVIATHIWTAKAISGSESEKSRAITQLRKYGSERALLNLCEYHGAIQGLEHVILNSRFPTPLEQARTVYYRVTDTHYSSARSGGFNVFAFDDRARMPRSVDETGELRERSSPQLSLASSRIDGSLDPDAALGYLEWTMVFKNTSPVQQEARAQLALPPGGVVSRLTLWINGEEREAAFAQRGKVQAAYDQVVRVRRDPVLVTTDGGDLVNVQCFPVQPNGEMKIRLGVTAPMQIEMMKGTANTGAMNEIRSEAWMRMPYVIDRNFQVGNGLAHSIWIESKRPLESSSQALKPEHPAADLFAVRGELAHAEMAKSFPAVRGVRSALVTEAWTRDPFSQTGEIITQRVEPQSSSTPMRAVFVIDGSASMRGHANPIADTLAGMPERGEFALVVASDEVVELAQMQPATRASAVKAAESLKRFEFHGGQDNLPAITRAWEIASRNPDSTIVWIHDPVPVLFGSTDDLRQRWERRPSSGRLFDLQTRRGRDLISENLRGVSAVNRITRMGDTPQELQRLFTRFSGDSQQFTVTRAKLPADQLTATTGSKETSKHLSRLWASDEISNFLKTGGDKNVDAAMKLAASYQLVTPLTGAIVLETQEQFHRAGLEPVKSGTVPTIPEPEEWLLMLSALLILFWIFFRRRLACKTV